MEEECIIKGCDKTQWNHFRYGYCKIHEEARIKQDRLNELEFRKELCE